MSWNSKPLIGSCAATASTRMSTVMLPPTVGMVLQESTGPTCVASLPDGAVSSQFEISVSMAMRQMRPGRDWGQSGGAVGAGVAVGVDVGVGVGSVGGGVCGLGTGVGVGVGLGVTCGAPVAVGVVVAAGVGVGKGVPAAVGVGVGVPVTCGIDVAVGVGVAVGVAVGVGVADGGAGPQVKLTGEMALLSPPLSSRATMALLNWPLCRHVSSKPRTIVTPRPAGIDTELTRKPLIAGLPSPQDTGAPFKRHASPGLAAKRTPTSAVKPKPVARREEEETGAGPWLKTVSARLMGKVSPTSPE